MRERRLISSSKKGVKKTARELRIKKDPLNRRGRRMKKREIVTKNERGEGSGRHIKKVKRRGKKGGIQKEESNPKVPSHRDRRRGQFVGNHNQLVRRKGRMVGTYKEEQKS